MLNNSRVILKETSQITIGWACREVGRKTFKKKVVKSETPFLKVGEEKLFIQERESKTHRVIENSPKMRFFSIPWSNRASV
jgi:hypothetical protein